MIRVLLADDEPMIRAGVRAILATDPDIEVVAEAGDGRAAVELARAHRPDVVLLDIRMPVLDGLAAAAEIAPGPAGDRRGHADHVRARTSTWPGPWAAAPAGSCSSPAIRAS